MAIHFGIITKDKPDGMKLTRENYIRVNKKSSLLPGYIYTDQEIKKQIKYSLYNFDLNMNFFKNLSTEEFNNDLTDYLTASKVFVEIDDLSVFKEISGYYMMVLDEYKQVYIGKTKDIKLRLQQHWSRQKQFDRLVFGSKENSVLSIDSFRAYDTTRIFVYPTSDNDELTNTEYTLIDRFNPKYLLNRTAGGSFSNGLLDAAVNQKKRIFTK